MTTPESLLLARKMRARHLARLMLERRQELGLTAEEATARSGLSRSTYQALENAKRERYQSTTFAAVDGALLWQAGTARALFTGDLEEPVPEPEPAIGRWDDATWGGSTWRRTHVVSVFPDFTTSPPPGAGRAQRRAFISHAEADGEQARQLRREIVADLEVLGPDGLTTILIEVKRVTVSALAAQLARERQERLEGSEVPPDA